MLFTLEALDADEGDCLLVHYGTADDPHLVLVDGGPGGTYAHRLRPRLAQLKEARGMSTDEELPLELVIVTHTDADHIMGVLEMVRELVKAEEESSARFVRVENLWHNAFDGETGGSAGSKGASGAEDRVAQHELQAQAASLKQGNELWRSLGRLGLRGNGSFDGPVMLGRQLSPEVLAGDPGVAVTVVGPGEAEHQSYRESWEAWCDEQQKKGGSAHEAAFTDSSKTNMASITTLIEMKDAEGKPRSILLTGDARGDRLLQGLKYLGRLEGGAMHVDVLKLPHHGSDRNVDDALFEGLTADHYVICANGAHDNPDVKTLEMLRRAHADDAITLWLTFPEHAFEGVTGQSASERRRRAALERVDRWLHESCPDQWEVRYRDPDAASIMVSLGDESP